ncbi:hypothetical protein J0H58_21775 [bacterium]|nr:hypothetical protein [bacterium]
MSEVLEWVLTPSKHDERSRSMGILLRDWDAAIQLCRRHGGYTPPETSGMTREQVKWFAAGLRKAEERGKVGDEARGWFERLLAFLDADGRTGFTLERKWKRCPTRNNPGTMANSPQPARTTKRRRTAPKHVAADPLERFHHSVRGSIFIIDPSKPVH